MLDTSARHGPSPTASVESVKSSGHQPNTTTSTAQPSPPASANGSPDLLMILAVAVILAIAVRVFWKAIIALVIVGGLTVVFAVVLGPIWMVASRK